MLNFLAKVFLFFLKIAALVLLPFVILLRGSIYLYAEQMWNPWLAVLTALVAAGIVIFIYLNLAWKKLLGKKKISAGARKVQASLAGVVVLFYGLYGIVYLSGDNVKTKEIRRQYGKVHPILRLAVSTVTLVDKEALITDLARTHSDYAKMGLKALNNSLHYKQKDGFVHAVDFRTNGRNETRNQVLKFYFRLMGFNTLRHTGTADHLHISLLIHENRAAI